jgi:SAM-dependent methyltransferase
MAEGLPLADASVDAVLACLVFEHLPDHRGPMREIARVLRPGGVLMFLLNHPVMQTPGSGWVVDHILEEEYWRVGPYLETSVVEEELSPGVILPFVHRPLSNYVDGLADAGFLVERLIEPAPPQTFLDRAPEYADTGHIPRLLGIRARKGQIAP